jgi:hypothetical protein
MATYKIADCTRYIPYPKRYRRTLLPTREAANVGKKAVLAHNNITQPALDRLLQAETSSLKVALLPV